MREPAQGAAAGRQLGGPGGRRKHDDLVPAGAQRLGGAGDVVVDGVRPDHAKGVTMHTRSGWLILERV